MIIWDTQYHHLDTSRGSRFMEEEAQDPQQAETASIDAIPFDHRAGVRPGRFPRPVISARGAVRLPHRVSSRP
jgi:hypothetical protein